MTDLADELLEAELKQAGLDDVARWAAHIIEAAKRFEFAGKRRLAMWLAQCGHESAGFTVTVENLNYSAAGLRATWPKRFPSDEVAVRYARQSEKIANYVYANRNGNGDEASGDGWKYRGRGLIQVTGRANYLACGKALSQDLLTVPELLESDSFAALSAGWFWKEHGLNELSDRGDIIGATKKINGGATGLADRRKRWARAKAALGVEDALG